MSIKRIAARLGVSASSVSVWTQDIALTPDQHAALRDANPIYNRQLRGQGGRHQDARREREQAQELGRAMARANCPLHRAGCMLYWAEGSKTRNSVRFTNSDADMVAYFVRFLRECYAIDNGRISLSVNCFLNNGLTLAEIEAWWLDRLKLPWQCLRRATINQPSKASRFRRNTLLFGTARVSVNSTATVQSIYGAIQEYAGTTREDWIDGGVGALGIEPRPAD